MNPTDINAFALSWVAYRAPALTGSPAPTPTLTSPPATTTPAPQAPRSAFTTPPPIIAPPAPATHVDAVSAWAAAFPNRHVPWMLRYIADRADKVLPFSHELNAVLDSYPLTFPSWDGLADDVHDPAQVTWGRSLGLVGEGRVVLRYLATKAAQNSVGTTT